MPTISVYVTDHEAAEIKTAADRYAGGNVTRYIKQALGLSQPEDVAGKLEDHERRLQRLEGMVVE